MNEKMIVWKGRGESAFLNITKISECLECVLLALLLNMNALKLMLEMYKESQITLLFFALFIGMLVRDLPQVIHTIKKHVVITGMAALLLCVTYLSMMLGGLEFMMDWVKFFMCVLIALKACTFTVEQIKRTLFYSIYFATVYGVFILLNFDKFQRVIQKGLANYLVITLPIGFSLGLALVLLFFAKDLKERFIGICASGVLIVTLFAFSARGNIIFPLVIIGVLMIIHYVKDPKTLIQGIGLGLFILILMWLAFKYLAPESFRRRMMRLIFDFTNEPRIQLYLNYANYIFTDYRWISGIGFKESFYVLSGIDATATYPHNYLLELLGEFGVFGFLTGTALTVSVVAAVKKSMNALKSGYLKHREQLRVLLYLTTAAFLFYFMSYFKSYSVWDGYQLFAMGAFVVAMGRHLKEAEQKNMCEQESGE